MSNVLAKLFGSSERIKLIRLFLLNMDEVLAIKDISVRAKINTISLKKEINLLSDIDFIRRKKMSVSVLVRKGSKKMKTKKIEGWSLNSSFSLLEPLKELVLGAIPVLKNDFLKKMSKTGHIKLIVLAGIFIQKDNSRVDILIVGDKIRKNILEKELRSIEAELGKELNYAIFETKDFVYRINMYDKFIRDIFDYPHQKILDKIGV